MRRREVLLTAVVAVLAVTSAALAGITLDLRGDLEEAREERDDAERERRGIQHRLNRTFSTYAWSAGGSLRAWDEPWAREHPVLEEAQRNLHELDRVLYTTAPVDPQARALWSATNATLTNLVNVEAAVEADLANRTTLAPGVAGVGQGLREVARALAPERYGDEAPPAFPQALGSLRDASTALERNLTTLLDPVARDRAELLHAQLNRTRNVTGASTDDGGGGGEGDEVPARAVPCDASDPGLEPGCPVANLTVTVQGTLPRDLASRDATWGLIACPSYRSTHPGSGCYNSANRAAVSTRGPGFPNVTRVDDRTVRVTVPLDLVDHDEGLLLEVRSKLGTHLYRDRCLLPANGGNATCQDPVDDAEACTRFPHCPGDRDGSAMMDLAFQPRTNVLENGTLRGTVTLHYARGDGALRFLPLDPQVTLHANLTTPDGEAVTWTGGTFGEPAPYTNTDLAAVPPGGRVVRNVTWPGTWLTDANATYLLTLTYTTTNDAEVTDAHWNGTATTGTLALET